MDPIRRAAIDDHFPDGLAVEEPTLAGDARTLPILRAVAVALDQVVNRSNDDLRRYGAIEPSTVTANAGDFEHCRRKLAILALGAKVGGAMLAAIESQLGITAAPKKGKGQAAETRP